MKLTLLTDYSLRVLMDLAINHQRLLTISEISTRYQISNNHLMKVVYLLGKHGYVETIRGRSGGLRLAKPRQEIILGELVREMEKQSVLVECFPEGQGKCLIQKACRLKSILFQAQNAFFEVLDRFSLADLVDENQDLADILLRENVA